MSKIKMVYDWCGPLLPIVNNKINPDFIFKTVLDNTKNITFPSYGHYPGPSILMFKDMEIIPSFALKDNDTFIYPITNPESNGIISGFEKDNINTFFNGGRDILKDTNISDNILNRIRNGNGYLMMQMTGESCITDYHIKIVHSYFNEYQIPLNKIIYYISSVNAKELYKDYCDKNEIRYRMTVEVIEWFDYMAGVYIEDYGHLLPKNKDYSKIEKTFLCYNNRWRSHRACLYTIFYKRNLLEHSYFSMSDESGFIYESWADFWYSKKNGRDGGEVIGHRLDVHYRDIWHLSEQLPLVIDPISDNATKTMLILPESSNLHHKSLISVVTETNFISNDVFITEKTWKPIGNKHPFIIVGPYHSLYYLKQKGYKTFSDFFDESYDNMTDPAERLLRIGELCSEINDWSDTKKQEFYNQTESITKHNFELLQLAKLGYK
jgi:hypothetical protein